MIRRAVSVSVTVAFVSAALAAATLAGSAAAQTQAGTARAAGGKTPRAAAAASAPGKAAAAAPAVDAYARRFAGLCAACHGANGRSDLPGTPVLAGQPAFYSITQLFLFREGRRGNEAMTAVARTMTDDDLRGFSDFIGTLPPVPAPAPANPPDAARMASGLELARQHKCLFCHGTDLAGGAQVPRIAGQREDYLLASLQGFKSGTRPGYTQAMTGALSQVPSEDLDTLAYFAAHFSAAAQSAPGR